MSKNSKKKTYYVQGMHCASCELLIKTRLEKEDYIKSATAKLKNHQLTIETKKDHKYPSVQKLNEMFDDLGYIFYNKKPEINRNYSDSDKATAIIIVGAVIALFMVVENSGLLYRYNLTSESSLPAYFAFGVVAGISSCAALVGGLLLSMSAQWNEAYGNNSKKSFIPFLLFNGGRLLSFALLGGFLGLIGSFFSLSIALTASLTVLVCLFMVFLGLQMVGFSWAQKFTISTPKFVKNYIKDENELSGKYVPFTVGVLTFFLPCGFTLIAQSNALLSGSFISSSLMMLFFALGTLPMLALISFSSAKLYTNAKFNKMFSLTAGSLVILFALYTLNSQLNVLGVKSIFYQSQSGVNNVEVTKVKGVEDGEIQYINMVASKFEYSPSVINIKAGVPTKWLIENNGAVGCAQAVYSRGLYNDVILLKPGLNEIDIPIPKAGRYTVSCSMGMVPPITVNVL